MPLTYAFVLAILFLVFFVLEFLVPSGGILGVCATVCLAGAILIAFGHSSTAGFSFVLAALAVTPLVCAIMVRVWPKTPMGRRILNDPRGDQERAETAAQAVDPIAGLVGRVGTAASDMLPSGIIKIAGKRYDAVSTGVPIDRGTAVEVVRVIGRIIHVRPTEKVPEEADKKMREEETPTLETPVESLGIDDISDPLA